MKRANRIAALILLLLTIGAAPFVDRLVGGIYDKARPPEAPKTAETPPLPQPAPPEQPPPAPPPKVTDANTFTVKGRGDYAVKVKQSFDGGPGWDTLVMEGAGWVSLDGDQIRNIERFKVKNGRRNVVYIYAKGVNSLDEGNIVVDGDVVDTVWLDADILWNKPVIGAGYRHHSGMTGSGKKVTVSVTPAIRVKMGND